MRVGERELPAREVDLRSRRRALDRELEQLRRRARRTSREGVLRCLIERRGDLGVMAVRREREMTRVRLRVSLDLGQPPVDVPPALRALVLRHGRGEQRVHEPDPVAVPLEQLRVDRSFESRVRVGNAARRRSTVGSDSSDTTSSSARTSSVSDATRDRSASCAPPAPAERARELERVERIAAARLVDAEKLGPRQRDVELRANDAVDRRLAQRPDGQALDGERTALNVIAELEAACSPARDENADGLAAKAAERELEHGGGRRVEPLRVVDRDEHGARRREQAERAEDGKADPVLVGRSAVRVLEQERDLERVPPRRGKLLERLGQHVLEQIAERRVRQLHLAAGRAADEDRYERACAASTAASHSVVLPIPGSPSSTNAHGPSATRATKPFSASRSSSRANTSTRKASHYPVRASAPATTSRISCVISACRARFIASVMLSISSPADFDALRIAVMRAPCSDAADSSSAR